MPFSEHKSQFNMYFLARHCFVCREQSYWVILDIARDKYLCVAHDDLADIAHRLYGWPDPACDGDTMSDPDEDLLTSLVSHGILTTRSDQGKAFAESDHRTRTGALDGMDLTTARKTSPVSIYRFMSACCWTDWQLHTRPISKILDGIERRRCPPPRGRINIAYVAELIGMFRRLRPYYPRSYLCLFESLALLEFFAAYHFYPQMVFGVVADPFAAHCWLQSASVVLNDDFETVLRYQPILRVRRYAPDDSCTPT